MLGKKKKKEPEVFTCPPLLGKNLIVKCKATRINECLYCPVRDGGEQPEQFKVNEEVIKIPRA